MHWRLWRLLERTCNAIGIGLVMPGFLMLEAGNWCKHRKWAAKARITTPIRHSPAFKKAREIE